MDRVVDRLFSLFDPAEALVPLPHVVVLSVDDLDAQPEPAPSAWAGTFSKVKADVYAKYDMK